MKKEKETVTEEVEEVVEDILEEETAEEKLNKEIAALKAENEKLRNDYVRAFADTENTRKRLNAEAEMVRKYRIQSFAAEILPVLDNLERALKQGVSEENQSFHKGVEMIYEQLVAALKKEGVSEIECLDKDFDPNFHQAIMMEKKEGVEPNKVIEVFQKGYVLKDRLLRAAMVKVSE